MIEYEPNASLARHLAEVQELSQYNALEASGPDHPLKVDWNQYLHMQESGHLLLTVATDKPRGIAPAHVVGYLMQAVTLHPTYGETWAVQIGFFVLPGWRKSGVAARLDAIARRSLRARGVKAVTQSVPTGGRDIGAFLCLLGYKPLETVYQMRL